MIAEDCARPSLGEFHSPVERAGFRGAMDEHGRQEVHQDNCFPLIQDKWTISFNVS